MQKQTKYSLNWSATVYNRFKNSHTRAAEIVNQIYDIDDRMPPVWLANGYPRWLNYKRAVKVWEDWDEKWNRFSKPLKPLNMRIVEFKEFIESDLFWRNRKEF